MIYNSAPKYENVYFCVAASHCGTFCFVLLNMIYYRLKPEINVTVVCVVFLKSCLIN
jgi:hypothetical protein